MSSAPPAYSEKGGPPMSLHDWLKGLDCGVYAKRFAGINTITDAMALTDDMMKSMDVVSGHRHAILDRIASMTAAPVFATADGLMKSGLMKRGRVSDAM
eukprot:gene6964-22065_t